MAPAAVPSSIQQERDPVKRAKLMRMHRVATARILVSTLKRRQRLLSNTLNKARKEGKPAEQIEQLRMQMNELGKSLREANLEMQKAQDDVESSR